MVKKILDLFDGIDIRHKSENFDLYHLNLRCDIINYDIKWNSSLYYEINSFFLNYDYQWDFQIEDIDFITNQNKFQELDFSNLLTENFEVDIKVFKKSHKKYIFDSVLFLNFFANLNLESILKTFNAMKKPIEIYNLGKIKTSSNLLGYNDIPTHNLDTELSVQSQFYNLSEFKFSPENFVLTDYEPSDQFLQTIRKLNYVFILIFLYDISEIKDDTVILKIKGGKTFDFIISFKNLSLKSFCEYKKIYDWVYSEKQKTEDKLGIARNIISFYLNANSVDLDDRVFPSILSANELYIKSNLTKYLDSRNKIYDQVDQISSRLNNSLETFFNNFQKSVFIYISFYITIYLYKILNKSDATTAISKEATITGLGLIFLSLIFMVFSLLNLKQDLEYYKRKYQLLKERFKNILVSDDVDKILDGNSEYNSEIALFLKKRKRYIIVWIITIIVLLIVLFTTSEYINFKHFVKTTPQK